MTGIGSSCGACKFLRRRCSEECVFAPHFCYDEAAATFAAVHKVFGASNVSKLLSNLPLQNRGEAAGTISYEALARMHDPVYGCVAHIFALQQQVVSLQEEIETLEIQMATHAVDDNLNNNGYFPYAPPKINNGLEFPSHEQDEMYMQILQTCQTHENPIISQTGNISANRALFSQMNLQPPQVYGPGAQSSLPYLSPNPFEILFEEGVDQEIFPMQHQLMYFQN